MLVNASMNAMPFQDPSFNYFCISCRKALRYSLRIIAKIQSKTSYYMNLCPPCLCSIKYYFKISDYYICRKMNQPLSQLKNLRIQQALECVNSLQKQGIEQICFKGIDTSNHIFSIYKCLNSNCFKDLGLDLDLTIHNTMINTSGIQKEKFNPPNRKHLKALGYSCERHQFSYQPEIVFGYLMGTLDENDQNSEEESEMRQIIYKYYSKQMQSVNDVNDFLVITMFLLGRKGLSQMDKVPSQIIELMKFQNEIKELITSVYTITDQDYIQKAQSEQTERSDSKKHKNSHKHKKQMRNHLSFSQDKLDRNNQDDRSRTRQKKKKKKKINNSTQKQEIIKNVQHKQSKQKIQDSQKQQIAEVDNRKQSSIAPSLNSAKRKRGRPAGSKNRVRQADLQIGRSKFVLKMNIDNKKKRLQQKKNEKRKEQQPDNRSSPVHQSQISQLQSHNQDNNYINTKVIQQNKESIDKKGQNMIKQHSLSVSTTSHQFQ